MAATSGPGSNPAINIVNDYFKTDVGKAVSKPDKPQSEAVLKSGFIGSAKISTVSHQKLEAGKLSQDQDAIVTTLLDAVSKIGGSTSKGTITSNVKAADKIAQRVLKEYGGDKVAAQRDLGSYAQQIRSAQLERVFSQTTSGPVSKASLKSEGLMKEQWAENISEGFIVGKERNLDKISVDIDRYSSLDRLSFQDSEGNAIDIKGFKEFQDAGGDFKDYVGKEMLPKMMAGVGLAEKGADGQIKLTDEGQNIIDDFMAEAGEKTSADELREPVANLISNLSKNGSSGAKRLRFAMIATSQNWSVSPGGKLGLIARKGAEPEKYTSMATRPDPEKSKITITLSKDGSMRASVQSGHIPMKKDGLHETLVDAKMEFNPSKSDDVNVSFDVSVKVPVEHKDHPEVKGLQTSLNVAGFNPKITVDNG